MQSGVSTVTGMSAHRALEPDDLEGAFTFHMTHGHLFRSLIHVLRDLLMYGILELTPTRMRLLRLDKTERVIVSIDIDTRRFFQYLFVSRKGVIRVGINFSVLWQCIKVIGKQDSFIMSKNDGDDFLVLVFGNAARQQYSLQGVCEQHISIPQYRSRQPNIYITVKELTKTMSYLRTERGRARIKGYRDRLIVEALGGKKMIQRMGMAFDDVWRRVGLTPEKLQEMLVEDPSLSCSLHLNESRTAIAELEVCQNYPKYSGVDSVPTVDAVQSHLVLKSLSKVYTIAPNSSVLATVEQGKPIRIVIPIGDYGNLTLYLLESSWNGGHQQEATAGSSSLQLPTAVRGSHHDADPAMTVTAAEEEKQPSPPLPEEKQQQGKAGGDDEEAPRPSRKRISKKKKQPLPTASEE